MCDSVIAAAPLTSEGTTLFAKNSDRHAGEAQPFVQHASAFHPRAAEVVCTHITIPQVAETYRVMGHSPWWVWGFEHGVNEHGVAIGNQSVFSREPVEEAPGLIGMDLVRLGLERGRDAREALEVIAGLLEAHGQGGSGFGPGEGGYHNSFMLADPEQAWVLETSGRRWAARSVDLEALSNHITLADDWAIGSRDLESFARLEGWWHRGDRVDVGAAYRNLEVPTCISEGRLRRSRALLQADRGKLDVAAMAALLRDHGAPGAGPQSHRANDDEARYTLCMHAEPVGTTTASMIAPLPMDRSSPWPVWICFGSPCLGVFLPVYIDGVLPPQLARGGATSPDDPSSSLWWAMHRVNEVVALNAASRTPIVTARFAQRADNIESDRRRVEAEALALALADEQVEVARVLSDFMGATVRDVMDDVDDLLAAMA